MSLMIKIQGELKAPKGQTNKFGNYKYRSCEDIVEAVKPILNEHRCFLNITDDIRMMGDRFYIEAIATVFNEDNIAIATSHGFAREAFSKKGMDEAQITGAASSYARKYALNGLFAIDDTKDADTQDNRIDNTVALRQAYIDRAYEVYKIEVEAEVFAEEGDFKKVQQTNQFLTNDERIEVEKKFGNETVPNSKKQLKTVLRELITKKEEL